MTSKEIVLLENLVKETLYLLSESNGENIDESIKSHIAAAGMGALATFGAMSGQNSDTAKSIKVPQAIHQSYQQPEQQSKQQTKQQTQSSFIDSIGYKVPSRFQHLKTGLEEVQYWIDTNNPNHKKQAKVLLNKWEKHIDSLLRKLGKNPSDLFVDRKGLVRLKFKQMRSGMSCGPGETIKPFSKSKIKYLKTLD